MLCWQGVCSRTVERILGFSHPCPIDFAEIPKALAGESPRVLALAVDVTKHAVVRYDRTIVAYHGCGAAAAERILAGESFTPSENSYDWLGSGVYFWEFGADRALRFAEFQQTRGRVRMPTVVGALIQLGRCFDLMDTRYTSELAGAYEAFARAAQKVGKVLPKNEGRTPDRTLRKLDCAVMNFYLEGLKEAGIEYDSVRCAFVEGAPVYPGSGIHQESHIQICIREPTCILGVFRPIL